MRSVHLSLAVTVLALSGCVDSPTPSLGELSVTAPRARPHLDETAWRALSADKSSKQTLTQALPAAEPELASPDLDSCPAGMVLVEGSYCPDVEQRCLSWMDPEGPYHYFRCKEYAQPARCKSATRVRMRFCIDRDEYGEEHASLPENNKSFTDAVKTCGSQGKRVCRESEWNFACEGEEMRPYPYGFERDPTACNADHTDIVNAEGKLIDRRAPSDSYPRCESPFGVRNMSGNLEEFVERDGRVRGVPAMKGAYWQPSRNFCRAAQTKHDAFYHGTETGFRCCADAD